MGRKKQVDRCIECGSLDKQCMSEEPVEGCECARCERARADRLEAEVKRLEGYRAVHESELGVCQVHCEYAQGRERLLCELREDEALLDEISNKFASLGWRAERDRVVDRIFGIRAVLREESGDGR